MAILAALAVVLLGSSGNHSQGWAMDDGLSSTQKSLPYQIVFHGNSSLGDRALRQAAKKELSAFDLDGHKQSDIDDAAFEMTVAYRKAGFPFATVNYDLNTLPEKLLITFSITESPRVTLGNIGVTGNTVFEEKSLLAFFKGHTLTTLGKRVFLYV